MLSLAAAARGSFVNALKPAALARSFSAESATLPIKSPFVAHRTSFALLEIQSIERNCMPQLNLFLTVCDGPNVDEVETSKDELLKFHKQMFTIRRMEIACDTEYKVSLTLQQAWMKPRS